MPQGKQNPEKNPRIFSEATVAKTVQQEIEVEVEARAVAKHKKSISGYNWLCDLDEAKGLTPGRTYRNINACTTFIKYIATTAKDQVADKIKKTKFVSVTSDGATDASIIEQEIVFVRYSSKGEPVAKFAGLRQPVSPDVTSLFQAIMEALEDVGLNKEELEKKLVGFGCDGASVVGGKKGGVSAYLTRLQPNCITVHCFAHRLELAFKDAVKENRLYDNCIVLLMGLYYFYQSLKQSFLSLKQSSLMPARVGGTRWAGHMLLAIENFVKGYPAIRAQLEICITQKVRKHCS